MIDFNHINLIIYDTVYNKDVEKDLEEDFYVGGDFKRILVSQLAGNREEDPEIDEEKVKKDAQELYDVSCLPLLAV